MWYICIYHILLVPLYIGRREVDLLKSGSHNNKFNQLNIKIYGNKGSCKVF